MFYQLGMNMRQVLIMLMMSFMATYSFADDKAKLAPYLSLLPDGTDISILVQSVEKNPTTILSYQDGQFRQPASLQKLITALAAQLELGNDFRFITKMLTDGKIENKQLKGNLVIQMSGDPTFTRIQLGEMLTVLKLKGIDKISGNIIIDTSIFNGHDKASGWSWNNLTASYNTAPSAMLIDENYFYAGILPGKKIGEKATISVSPLYPITLTSDVRTIAKESQSLADKYCELDIIPRTQNHYHLTGCIKQSHNKSYFKFAIMDHLDYFSKILKSQLKEKNIQFNGKIGETKKPLKKALTPLTINQSEPLPELLTMMLKKSNNLIADTLFRTIGAHHFKVPGTWKSASDATKEILLTKANINLENAVLNDGSGLSRLNLIDAKKLMSILQFIAANDETLHLIDKLPIAGVDGTLQYRKSFTGKEFKSVIYAKTGHLEGNYNLAGFIKLEEHKYIAFVQFITGYNYVKNNNEPTNTAIINFEKALYQKFIQK